MEQIFREEKDQQNMKNNESKRGSKFVTYMW